jgi:hypothetical protein
MHRADIYTSLVCWTEEESAFQCCVLSLMCVTHVVPVGGRGHFGVRGARGRMGLMGMRQLILSKELIWVEVRILAQLATTPSKRVSFFGGPASCLTVPRTIWSEWTQSDQSPWLAVKIPLKFLFRTVNKYYSLCIHCMFLHPNSFQFSFLCLIKSSVQTLIFG